MKIEIINERNQQRSRVLELSADYSLSKGQHCIESEEVIADKGFIQQRRQLCLDGFHLNFFKKSSVETVETVVKSDGAYMQMHFEISGGAAFYQPRNQLEKALRTASGQFTFFYLPELDGRLVDPACQRALSLEIEVGVAWLSQYLSVDSYTSESFLKAMNRSEAAVLGGKSHPITPEIQQLIHEIYHCPYIGEVKRLYIEGKMLLLLALQLQQAATVSQSIKPISLSAGDRERLYYLKETLNTEISINYTLEELALLTAMNRTKMQAGFKQLFGMTIHDWVVEVRMNEAYRILTTAPSHSMSIAALAQRVGYKHYNHFSTAFKKRFGCVPSSFLKE